MNRLQHVGWSFGAIVLLTFVAGVLYGAGELFASSLVAAMVLAVVLALVMAP